MEHLLHDHPELPLLIFLLIASVVWAGVRRVVLAIVVTAVVVVLGAAALDLLPDLPLLAQCLPPAVR